MGTLLNSPNILSWRLKSQLELEAMVVALSSWRAVEWEHCKDWAPGWPGWKKTNLPNTSGATTSTEGVKSSIVWTLHEVNNLKQNPIVSQIAAALKHDHSFLTQTQTSGERVLVLF